MARSWKPQYLWQSFIMLLGVSLAISSPLVANSTEHSGSKKSEIPRAVQATLQQYGWSLPLCVWSNKDITSIVSGKKIKTGPLYCVTVSELLKRFPLERELITTQVIEAVSLAYAADVTDGRDPETIMQQVTGRGHLIGCVTKGPSQGVISIGLTSPSDLKSAVLGCDSGGPGSSSISDALVFGALVGSAPQTPSISLSAEGQATYEHYYQQCKERQRTNAGRRSVMEGSSATDSQKKADELQKKAQAAAEDAEKKQKTADEARQAAEDARKKADDANKNVQDVNNDPNASAADKQQAYDNAVTADNDARLADATATQAQKSADDAKAAADDAKTTAYNAGMDVDLQKAVDEAVGDYVTKATGGAALGALPATEGIYQAAVLTEFLSRMAGAYSGRYGHDCLEESGCGYESCHLQAKSKAIEDELLKDKSPRTCNTKTTPIPGDDRCYERPGGIFDVPQVTLVEAQKLACEMVQKVDRQCREFLPQRVSNPMSANICKSPYAMCEPEGSQGQVRTGTRNQSKPIPRPYRGDDPTVWGAPSSSSR